MYCINYLVRAGVRTCDVCVFRLLEFAEFLNMLNWHPDLTKKLSKDIERVQKRCLKLLFRVLSYAESLSKTDLEPHSIDRNHHHNRRDMITHSEHV